MRNLSPAFADHLAGGVTTLARCWRIARRDGVSLGFTDHDNDLVFNGVTFAARSGVDGAQAEASLGLSVGGSEISGALTSAALSEPDLANGLYDGASIEAWLVNWSDLSMRELLDVGTIGEITRSDIAFTAEIRSLAHAFDQTRGRLYQAGCSADLGDAQCMVALGTSAFSTAATAALGGRLDMRAELDGYADGWFTGGVVTFTAGGNTSARAVVKAHAIVGETHVVSFWTALAHPVQAGDAFTITAGCDKAFATCKVKFDNIANFRGFPHMPGNDVVTSYPAQGDANMDGGSLFR